MASSSRCELTGKAIKIRDISKPSAFRATSGQVPRWMATTITWPFAATTTQHYAS